MRLGGSCKAEWADLDLDVEVAALCYRVTDARCVMPLARQSVEIHRELYPVTGHGRHAFSNAHARSSQSRYSDAVESGAPHAIAVRAKSGPSPKSPSWVA